MFKCRQALQVSGRVGVAFTDNSGCGIGLGSLAANA